MAFQNRTRSSRRATDGLPGDHIWPHNARISNCRFPTPIAHHLRLEVLRRPVESAQYLSIRYTERLAEAEAVSSVGSRGDSYDNALAETVNGLYKAELINRQGPWRSAEQVALATADWVHFWNTRRLHEACGNIPPAEFEGTYHQLRAATAAA